MRDTAGTLVRFSYVSLMEKYHITHQNSSTHQKCQNILHGNMNMKGSHNIKGCYICIVKPKYLWWRFSISANEDCGGST